MKEDFDFSIFQVKIDKNQQVYLDIKSRYRD